MNKQGQGGAPQSTPVKGSATTNTDTALEILVERMEQMAYTMRSMEKRLDAVQTSQDKAIQVFHQEQADAKRQSAQALEAAKEALQQLQEATPADPQTTEALIDYYKQKAEKQAAKKKQVFLEQLENTPTGTLVNHTPSPLTIIINGVKVVVPPESQKEVPVPFIEQYHKQQELAQWAQEQEKLVRIEDGRMPEYGDMQAWRARNSFSSEKEFSHWGEDQGVV